MADLLGTTLHSRDKANSLFELLSSAYHEVDEIHLNFEGVEFMSRSFADEFHKAELKWKAERQPKVFIENVSLQVFEMLNAVSKTQKHNQQAFKAIEMLTINNPEELERFLTGF
jgi:hypothetical protein